MIFEIRLSPKAEETYNAVMFQLRVRWGEGFVVKLQTKLDKCFNNLTINPYMYPLFDEDTGLRKCLLHKNCSMLYKISENLILIAYFWDNRQEPLK